MLTNQHLEFFFLSLFAHHHWCVHRVTSHQSNKTQQHNPRSMSTHLQQASTQQGMGELLSSNGWTLNTITHTDKALSMARAKLCMLAWKRQKPGHLYTLAILHNYNYNNLVSLAPVMSVETRFGGSATASTIFSNNHHNSDTFCVPLTLLTTMEEAITRHTTDVALSTTSTPPAG